MYQDTVARQGNAGEGGGGLPGRTINRTFEPRMKHCSIFETRPSRAVRVTFDSCMFMLSSLSTKCPR